MGSPFISNASPCCSGPRVPLPTMRRSGRGCFRECSIFFRGPIDGRVTGGLAALGDGREATATSLRKEYARWTRNRRRPVGLDRLDVEAPTAPIRAGEGRGPGADAGTGCGFRVDSRLAGAPQWDAHAAAPATPSGNDRVIGIRPAYSVSASRPAPAYRFPRAPVSSRLASFRSVSWSIPAAGSRHPERTNRLGERPCLVRLDRHARMAGRWSCAAQRITFLSSCASVRRHRSRLLRYGFGRSDRSARVPARVARDEGQRPSLHTPPA